MANQDLAGIAQDWATFDDKRRNLLLAKLNADQKKLLRQALEGSARAAGGADALPDYTIKTKAQAKEGLYPMQDPSSGEFQPIPYSNVPLAGGQGWQMQPDVREQYARNLRAEVIKQHPHLRGPADPEYLKDMQLPEAIPPERPGLWQRGEDWVGEKTAPTTAFGTPTNLLNPYDPATGEFGLNTIKRLGRNLFGLADMGPQAWSALKDSFSADPQKAEGGAARLQALVDPRVQVRDRLKELKEEWHSDPKLALANVAGDVIPIWLLHKAGEVPSRSLAYLRQEAERRYAPRNVEVAGVNIPVGVGERVPTSTVGRTYTSLKRRGVEAPKFEDLEAEQQKAVKGAIRRTAEQAAGLKGPPHQYPLEPGAAMDTAAEAAKAQARPLYWELDKQTIKVPAAFGDASAITKQAIARARKLGVEIDLDPRVVDRQGKPVPGLSPKQIKDGLATGQLYEEFPDKQPLSTFQRVRSELLKMKRMSTGAERYAIGQEVDAMNTAMENALSRTLKGRQLLGRWKAAQTLWAQAYAREEVADALRSTTKGSPAEGQHPDLAKVPTEVQGAALVAKLNDLTEEGVLKRAFTPKQAENLRQSADVLVRIQKTNVGTGGEGPPPIYHSQAIAHALGGAKGPLTGAAIGAGVGALTGAGIGWGVTIGAGIGRLVQLRGERWLVDVMTTSEGAKLLREAAAAKNPSQLRATMNKLAVLTPATSAAHTSPKQLREEAARLRSAGALNPYPNPEDQPPDTSYAFNKKWAKSGPYFTKLSPQDEAEFQKWAKVNPQAVAGELNNPKADYDVRGHWLAAKQGDPAGSLVLNKWDGKLHGSDKFKTPYNGSFSRESIYATPNAPQWVGDRLMTKDGQLITDETPGQAAAAQ